MFRTKPATKKVLKPSLKSIMQEGTPQEPNKGIDKGVVKQSFPTFVISFSFINSFPAMSIHVSIPFLSCPFHVLFISFRF